MMDARFNSPTYKISRDEVITTGFWADEIAPNEWVEGDVLPPAGIIFVKPEHIKRFFEAIDGTGVEYIVVSGYGDYSIDYQTPDLHTENMVKFLGFVDKDMLSTLNGEDLTIPARYNRELCDPNDKYVMRMYMYSHSTFDKIPENVKKWYCTNPRIVDNKIVPIPIGILDKTADELTNRLIIAPEVKQHKTSVCWCNYTLERADLKDFFHYSNHNWCPVITELIPVDNYLRLINNSRFTLCPTGNGLDTYRIYEALYLNSIPIVLDNATTRQYNEVPVVRVPDLSVVTESVLDQIWEQIRIRTFDMSYITKSYWRNLFNDERRNFN